MLPAGRFGGLCSPALVTSERENSRRATPSETQIAWISHRPALLRLWCSSVEKRSFCKIQREWISTLHQTLRLAAEASRISRLVLQSAVRRADLALRLRVIQLSRG